MRTKIAVVVAATVLVALAACSGGGGPSLEHGDREAAVVVHNADRTYHPPVRHRHHRHHHHHHPVPEPTAPTSVPTPTTVAPPAPTTPTPPPNVSCGVERWDVKTGTDPAAVSVNLTPLPDTIADLAALPTTMPTARQAPIEETTFQLHATLVQFKMEADSDYHLVLHDGAASMIAEIPSPACVHGTSPFRDGIKNARGEFDARYTASASSWQTVNVPVTVTGVGFFDRLHGQTGVAPNGIELHPVLDIQFG